MFIELPDKFQSVDRERALRLTRRVGGNEPGPVYFRLSGPCGEFGFNAELSTGNTNWIVWNVHLPRHTTGFDLGEAKAIIEDALKVHKIVGGWPETARVNVHFVERVVKSTSSDKLPWWKSVLVGTLFRGI